MTFDVLVVTSLADEASLIRSILDREVISTLAASSVAEAERMMQSHPIDAVIADEYLPDGTWRDLAGMARLQTTDPPVIVMVAGIENADRENAQALGAFELMARPITAEPLLTLVYAACALAPTGHGGEPLHVAAAKGASV